MLPRYECSSAALVAQAFRLRCSYGGPPKACPPSRKALRRDLDEARRAESGAKVVGGAPVALAEAGQACMGPAKSRLKPDTTDVFSNCLARAFGSVRL